MHLENKDLLSAEIINTLDNNTDPWYIKDTKLKYIYANSPYKELIENDNLLGYTENEITSLFKKYRYLIEQHEINVMKKLHRISSIGNFKCKNNNKNKLLFFDKMPMINANNFCIGILSHVRETIYFNALDYLNNTSFLSIYTNNPNKLLTSREWKILFLFCRGISNKSISNEIGISQKTLENNLCLIYEKLTVSSPIELRILCKKYHYDLYIPKAYLNSLSYLII
ncbi:LuxR C-terminal-related transcriptional regulator [Moellerella wisconsensis]|uniref:response regulator transcription factor n=1 Tax=Moellerella wisconsensis TaxID=158849 RepID=UPI0025B03478|nr:LuxR C-terminal-related transcriptional regulator [Moellerella wisconsensis]WJW81377.1 LuxR C-terminal-related transcriptional regulator [Moellerella wisconsensis]